MKKFLAILAAMAILFSFAACGDNNDNDNDVITPDAEKTMGQLLLDDFNAVIKANADATTYDIASALVENDVIEFAYMVEDVSEGWLPGFSAETMSGFKNGTVFCPMMGSIAFVGYIFEVEDGADVDAFIQTLKDNANPRWQICVEADETLIDHNGNMVFFVMADNQLMADNVVDIVD